MKRLFASVLLAIAFACIAGALYQVSARPELPLSRLVPAGPVLYLEAKDFASLLFDWNAAPEKQHWIASTSYEVFSRSRLFLRLKGASDQFAAAGGVPPDMKFLAQVAGDQSAVAIYDIGKLQFLYITHLPAAQSVRTALWQTRSKFEPRTVGTDAFYVRRDPESGREVAFAVSGDYLLLATREDLVAGALQLISSSNNRTVETEQWFQKATAAAESPGDLRLVLNLGKIVPDGYFRTYWVQQNITDLSQYGAAVSDLFRSGNEYREERVLIRKDEAESMPSPESLVAVADAVRLSPENAGFYRAVADPSAGHCLELLTSKILAPHLGSAPASASAPQVQLTSGEVSGGVDLETRIDQAAVSQAATPEKSALAKLLDKKTVRAGLEVQSTARDEGGVFVRFRSAIVLIADSDWSPPEIQSALAAFIRPALTASELGVVWQTKANHQELDGVWPLTVFVRGNYLLVSDDPAFAEQMIANFNRARSEQPAALFSVFRHDRERQNFRRLTAIVDRPMVVADGAENSERQPQFFSGTTASLSDSLSRITDEKIVVRADTEKVHQTVTYKWSH